MRELSILSGSDVRRSLMRVTVSAVLIGLLLGTLGPFGTFERMETAERYGFWLACILAGACLHVPAYWLARYLGAQYGWSQVLLLPLSALVAAVPMTLMVNGIAVSLLGATNVDGFFELYPFVLAISLPVQLMSHLLQLWAEGKLAGEVPGPAQPSASPAMPPPLTSAGSPSPTPAAGQPIENAPVAGADTSVLAPQPEVSSVMAPAPPPADPPQAVAAAPAEARFLVRIPARLGRELLALEMEDHYLRIHTRIGSDLILMRMRDAVAELDAIEGLQVHRSWWVARQAVDQVNRDGKTMTLTLTNGRSVPVARDRQGEVRAAGWLD